jgi:hypothetical protein
MSVISQLRPRQVRLRRSLDRHEVTTNHISLTDRVTLFQEDSYYIVYALVMTGYSLI